MQVGGKNDGGIVQLGRDVGRAGGGALIFSLPMLMTMEMWELGLYLDRMRLLVLVLVALPMLVLLSRRIGIESTRNWRDDVLDAALALGISAVVCLVVLALFGLIGPQEPVDVMIGKIAIQMVPASIGALLARSQFAGSSGEDDESPKEARETYGGELFLMGIGALFLGLNVAPTEEMMLISYQMSEWHALALLVLSIGLMHAFVFAVGFAGGSPTSPEEPWWSPFLRLTLPGYVIAMVMSLLLLWVFARLDGQEIDSIVMTAVVLAFPSALGAAAARLVL
ncbi:TIGR02587 family membrane protein [Stappia indica]|uniref:TIGR02587 family membrane protein n=1 Tax=Stappia indica TaxID=538381 RepID=UPI001D181FCB|nr:TIGR02587 family membrane protein [Stappia indica]MCC4243594.1 TIGR02587 family membrane protein [Stappia indica]